MELINNIEEVVASAIDGIIIIYLLNKCFVKTNIDKYIYSFLFWLAIFVTGDWLEQNFIIQSIVLTSLVALYCGIILKVEPLKSIIAGVVVNVGLALVNILTIFLVGVLSGSEITELVDTSGTSRIVVIVLAKITFIFVGIIIVNMISHFVTFKRYQWVYICVYYMATFAICVLVCTLLVSGEFNAVETVIMLIVVMFIVLLNIMTYCLIVRINNENRAEMEKRYLIFR